MVHNVCFPILVARVLFTFTFSIFHDFHGVCHGVSVVVSCVCLLCFPCFHGCSCVFMFFSQLFAAFMIVFIGFIHDCFP